MIKWKKKKTKAIIVGVICVWYCGSCCGYDLKKIVFIKNIFSWGWFGKIYIWLKL